MEKGANGEGEKGMRRDWGTIFIDTLCIHGRGWMGSITTCASDVVIHGYQNLSSISAWCVCCSICCGVFSIFGKKEYWAHLVVKRSPVTMLKNV